MLTYHYIALYVAGLLMAMAFMSYVLEKTENEPVGIVVITIAGCVWPIWVPLLVSMFILTVPIIFGRWLAIRSSAAAPDSSPILSVKISSAGSVAACKHRWTFVVAQYPLEGGYFHCWNCGDDVWPSDPRYAEIGGECFPKDDLSGKEAHS